MTKTCSRLALRLRVILMIYTKKKPLHLFEFLAFELEDVIESLALLRLHLQLMLGCCQRHLTIPFKLHHHLVQRTFQRLHFLSQGLRQKK